MRDQRAVVRLPPVARQESRHDTVAIAAVPHEHSPRREHARELGDHSRVVARLGEETERRKKIEHGIETTGPTRRQLSHVAARVAKPCPSTATSCASEEVGGVVQTIHIESRFGEQVRMSSLSAWNVEHARVRR
jgi:cell division septation protein DedD